MVNSRLRRTWEPVSCTQHPRVRIQFPSYLWELGHLGRVISPWGPCLTSTSGEIPEQSSPKEPQGTCRQRHKLRKDCRFPSDWDFDSSALFNWEGQVRATVHHPPPRTDARAERKMVMMMTRMTENGRKGIFIDSRKYKLKRAAVWMWRKQLKSFLIQATRFRQSVPWWSKLQHFHLETQNGLTEARVVSYESHTPQLPSQKKGRGSAVTGALPHSTFKI